MQVNILVVRGKVKQQRVQLELPVIVGRSADAELTINDPAVSRQHCELYEAEGKVLVRDLGSTNGTRVGGRKVAEAVLRPHDRFTIGPFTLVVDYQQRGDATPSQFERRDDEHDAAEKSPSAVDGQALPQESPPSFDGGEANHENWLEEKLESPNAEEDVPKPKAVKSGRAQKESPPQLASSAADAQSRRSAKTTSSAVPATSTRGPDPDLGIDLDELLDALEGINLDDFLKGIE